MSNSYQDWAPAGWDKRHVKPTESKEKQVNIARRLGNTVVTAAKYDAGRNKNNATGTNMYARKVEEEDEVFTLPKVDLSFRLRLQKARTEKKLSQKELAMKLNVQASVIQDYESGKIIPNPNLISKMERILGVKLRESKK
ncbi:multiprotein bridging factor type [Blastocystis sp. ATCC 50177/Nand II]|uniref:Multiprotein bridging factor type n=1 Tax=Blastocystis sp. subtype 1 (strain ATCC 50177 / NandII) TaxID=478820 RepID=A0A196SJM5_BLAHN|nr:multiprotein bridging factor type [Blastocystis sp. ATCC 50177/Nand II]